MKLEDTPEQNQKAFKQRIEDKDNNRELLLEAVEEVEEIYWLQTFAYFMVASTIARLWGINFGFIGMAITYYIVTYGVAPYIAKIILKSQIRRYIDKNHSILLSQGSGQKLFALYDCQYALTWSTDEGELNPSQNEGK